MSTEETHFAQHLASNERKVRDKALARLRKWIRLRSQRKADEFNDDGMMKLWKGLFFCMWMSDKPLVQEELADNISSLIHAFTKPSQAYAFIGSFFKTFGEKHDQIDKYRIDKFLLLARRFFRESLKFLKNQDWQHKHVQKYLDTLRQSVLSQKQEPRKMALGFRLHFFDIFLEEMARVGEGEIPQKRAHNFLEPLYEILTYCKSPMVVEGVRDKIFYELIKLNAGCLQEDDVESESDCDVEGFLDDEAMLDESAFDSDKGEVAEVSDDEDEEHLSKRRKSDRGFIAESPGPDVDDEDIDSEYGNDIEEELIKEQEQAAEVHLLPVDFDLSAVKQSLREFLKIKDLRGFNKRALYNIVKKIVDLETGVNPFALPEEDSGSDLELDEQELRRAAKRLKLLERKYADDADNFLVSDRGDQNNDDDLDIEGNEDDLEEFERTFNGKREKRKPRKKKRV